MKPALNSTYAARKQVAANRSISPKTRSTAPIGPTGPLPLPPRRTGPRGRRPVRGLRSERRVEGARNGGPFWAPFRCIVMVDD